MKWKWPINMINCLTLLATREIEIKTSLSSHLTPVRMVIIKKTNKQKTNIGKDVGNRDHFYTADRNVDWTSSYSNHNGSHFKELEIGL